MALLGGSLILFEFVDVGEAERVLCLEVKWFNGKNFFLDWLNPSIECLEEERGVWEAWVRILGLSLHLWGKGLFKRLGETCGRFVAVDDEMVERQKLQSARVLIEIKGWKFPSFLLVVMGFSCFAIQLWWEIPPWSSEVQSSLF